MLHRCDEEQSVFDDSSRAEAMKKAHTLPPTGPNEAWYDSITLCYS